MEQVHFRNCFKITNNKQAEK